MSSANIFASLDRVANPPSTAAQTFFVGPRLFVAFRPRTADLQNRSALRCYEPPPPAT